MVGRGVGDFLELLLVLADVGVDGGAMYGRCPDCWRPITSENPAELIADILIHDLRYHPEHADQTELPGAGGADVEHDAHGDDPQRPARG